MNPGNNQKTKTSPVRAAHKKEDSAPKSLKSIIILKNMPLSHISARREAGKRLTINHLHSIFKWLTPTEMTPNEMTPNETDPDREDPDREG